MLSSSEFRLRDRLDVVLFQVGVGETDLMLSSPDGVGETDLMLSSSELVGDRLDVVLFRVGWRQT
jgi:ribosomal protein S4